MCVCQYIFTSLFRSWLNACHPPSPLLFSVPLVSIRLMRLWTILCPVSVVLAQTALRAAKKSCSLLAHSPHSTFLIPFFLPVLLCWWCARARQQPAASLSPPSSLALLVLVRPAAVVLPENSRGRGRISIHPAEPLGRCVFCTLAVPTSPYFHVGNTNIL